MSTDISIKELSYLIIIMWGIILIALFIIDNDIELKRQAFIAMTVFLLFIFEIKKELIKEKERGIND